MNDEEIKSENFGGIFERGRRNEKRQEEFTKSLECEPTEEGFQKLMAEIRRRESIENTNNYVTNVDDREKHTNKVKELKNAKWYMNKSNTKQGNTGRKRVIRWASVAAAVLIGVFGISMTSEANRAYIMREMNELFGNDVNTQVDNNDVIKSDRTEQYACEEIENILDIKMPRFFYLPDKLEYQAYSLDEESGAGILQYSYGEQIIFLTAFSNEKSASVLEQNDSGIPMKTFSNELVSDLEITLWKIEDEEDEFPTYSLKWEYKNCYYEFFGKIEKEEMENIAENIVY